MEGQRKVINYLDATKSWFRRQVFFSWFAKKVPENRFSVGDPTDGPSREKIPISSFSGYFFSFRCSRRDHVGAQDGYSSSRRRFPEQNEDDVF